jgi:hypothetical protein
LTQKYESWYVIILTKSAGRRVFLDTEKLVEIYFAQDSQSKTEFLNWYRNVHLQNVDAIKQNPNIVEAEIYEVDGIDGVNVIVLIEIKKGTLNQVVSDPGMKEILSRAAQHGMNPGRLNPIPLA